MKNNRDFKDRYDCGDLMDIVRILRAPGGCPWDREQTHESIKKNFIEETYEEGTRHAAGGAGRRAAADRPAL